MEIMERVLQKLEPHFQTMEQLGTPTLLFGYLDPVEGSYTVEALARKVVDEIQIKTRPRKEWTPITDLSPVEFRRLTLWTWDVQHIFQDVSVESPLASYCWCGFHEQQHTENDRCVAHGLSREECINHLHNKSNREVYRLYERMRDTEVKLHQSGLCSNSNGCGLQNPL